MHADKEHLQWIHDRLVQVYAVDEREDWMWKLREIIERQGWQQISTAPKDGTAVILGHWNYCDGWAWEQTLASWDKSFLMWHTVGYNNPHTHWHPISEPPRREA